MSCGLGQEIETVTTNACLAAVHPEILGARFLTMREFFDKKTLSERAFKSKIGNNVTSPPPSRFGAAL